MNFATSFHTTTNEYEKVCAKYGLSYLFVLKHGRLYVWYRSCFLIEMYCVYKYWRRLTDKSIHRVKAMRRPMVCEWTDTGTYAFFIYGNRHLIYKTGLFQNEVLFWSTSKNMINIGECIKEEMTRQDRSISWLARKLNKNRTAVYRIISKNSIDTHLLSSISMLLHRDFFADLSCEIKDKLNPRQSSDR